MGARSRRVDRNGRGGHQCGRRRQAGGHDKVTQRMTQPGETAATAVSISDLLYSVEMRGRTWCYLDVPDRGGFSIPPNEAIYIILDGGSPMLVEE